MAHENCGKPGETRPPRRLTVEEPELRTLANGGADAHHHYASFLDEAVGKLQKHTAPVSVAINVQ